MNFSLSFNIFSRTFVIKYFYLGWIYINLSNFTTWCIDQCNFSIIYLLQSYLLIFTFCSSLRLSFYLYYILFQLYFNKQMFNSLINDNHTISWPIVSCRCIYFKSTVSIFMDLMTSINKSFMRWYYFLVWLLSSSAVRVSMCVCVCEGTRVAGAQQ